MKSLTEWHFRKLSKVEQRKTLIVKNKTNLWRHFDVFQQEWHHIISVSSKGLSLTNKLALVSCFYLHYNRSYCQKCDLTSIVTLTLTFDLVVWKWEIRHHLSSTYDKHPVQCSVMSVYCLFTLPSCDLGQKSQNPDPLNFDPYRAQN